MKDIGKILKKINIGDLVLLKSDDLNVAGFVWIKGKADEIYESYTSSKTGSRILPLGSEGNAIFIGKEDPYRRHPDVVLMNLSSKYRYFCGSDNMSLPHTPYKLDEFDSLVILRKNKREKE